MTLQVYGKVNYIGGFSILYFVSLWESYAFLHAFRVLFINIFTQHREVPNASKFQFQVVVMLTNYVKNKTVIENKNIRRTEAVKKEE